MCELFAMSSLLPADVTYSLTEFAQHGGRTGPHRNGWGIAHAEDGDVRLIKDTDAAADSPSVRFVANGMRRFARASRRRTAHSVTLYREKRTSLKELDSWFWSKVTQLMQINPPIGASFLGMAGAGRNPWAQTAPGIVLASCIFESPRVASPAGQPRNPTLGCREEKW